MDKNTEILVTNTLKELGISANRCGYHFIKEAINFRLNPRNAGYSVMTMYTHLANVCDTSCSKVERGIRSAIETGVCRGDPDAWARIFSYSYSPLKGRPTNSEFVATLVEYIQLHKEN